MNYNVYCDESCHLEHDGINVMTLGAVWCSKEKVKVINSRIIEIKEKHGIYANAEIKWTKVSPSKLCLYSDIVDYFFSERDLHFRGLVIPDKGILNHDRFAQTHDDWYYKMYFDMLKAIFSPNDAYNIYIDIKDTHSYRKAQKLHEVCCNSAYDFSARIIKKIQPIRSHEVQIMQLVDILTGALGYRNRRFPETFSQSEAKKQLISQIQESSHYSLTQTTLYRESKVNLLVWESNK
ncbi:hypothetical protein UF75_3141 [Desulfosporosinus sp. I2]|uniref:DUF3800 domain-containing protein n=1 Tax=Desulfosporosinus sp. I2 TaxID=1617025 RepID=UPI0005F08D5A|nr:DUF3800 domain-containing protein [Desulfosporosinus sp. I2]KJR46476.1 hypothetical protein UF75_3141 [Desulfosporosinus sp. I2]